MIYFKFFILRGIQKAIKEKNCQDGSRIISLKTIWICLLMWDYQLLGIILRGWLNLLLLKGINIIYLRIYQRKFKMKFIKFQKRGDFDCCHGILLLSKNFNFFFFNFFCSNENLLFHFKKKILKNISIFYWKFEF